MAYQRGDWTSHTPGTHTYIHAHRHTYVYTSTHTWAYINVHVCVLSCFSRVRVFETLWTVASQAPLSMGFSRQEYWSGLPCPPPWDLPDAGIKSVSLTVAERSSPLAPPGIPILTHMPTHKHAHIWTGTPCFTELRRYCFHLTFFFFNKLKVCSNPASSRSISTTVPRAHSHFASQRHIWVILEMFQIVQQKYYNSLGLPWRSN